VTGNHHNPMNVAADQRTLVCVVHVADRLVGELEEGYRLDLLSLDIAPEVKEALGLTSEKIEEIQTDLPEHLKSVGEMLS
jgi:hypothetical protein